MSSFLLKLDRERFWQAFVSPRQLALEFAFLCAFAEFWLIFDDALLRLDFSVGWRGLCVVDAALLSDFVEIFFLAKINQSV